MTERDEPRETERLTNEAARRLLARASELEAARSSELSVAELREAAREAGITPSAFEQALAELRARDSLAATAAAPMPSWARHLARSWPTALLLAALLSILLLRLLFPPT